MAVPRVVVRAAVVVLALTSAACGDSGGSAAKTVSAVQWVDTVCGSLGRYDKATRQPFLVFQGLHLQFKYGVPTQSDVRDKQIAASQSIVTATDHLIAELEAAVRPRRRTALRSKTSSCRPSTSCVTPSTAFTMRPRRFPPDRAGRCRV